MKPENRNNQKETRRSKKRRVSFFVGNNQQNISTQFGIAVKRKRTTLGINQTELAKLSGLNRSYISELEHGYVNISLDRANILATALNCTLKDLLEPKL